MRTAMATILSLLHSANASEKLANKSELYPYICSCKLEKEVRINYFPHIFKH